MPNVNNIKQRLMLGKPPEELVQETSIALETSIPEGPAQGIEIYVHSDEHLPLLGAVVFLNVCSDFIV